MEEQIIHLSDRSRSPTETNRDSDVENAPVKSCNANDSDSDTSPVKCKSKSTRRRGLAARLKNSGSIHTEKEQLSEHATVYSTKVSKLFGAYKNESGNVISSIMKQNSVKRPNIEEDSNIVHTNKDITDTKIQNEKEEALCIDSDQEDIPLTPTTVNSTVDLVKSPTPPPPPSPPQVNTTKRPRMSKCLKNAIRNICDAKEHLIVEERQTRFSCDDQDVVCLDDADEDNLTVRIKFRTDVYRCPLRKDEPFKRIMNEISSKIGVASQRVLMVLNDRTIHTYDSPKSLDLQVADIIHCYLSSEDQSFLEDSLSEDFDSIQLFVQSRHSKHKDEFKISRNQPVDEILRKYSIQKNIDISKLKLQFDGEDLLSEDTPNELELEDGYCLDIIHLS